MKGLHIPDGYLGPQTYVPLYAVSATFCAVALKKIRNELSHKHIPYIAMAAAFSFLIMMFNVPVPGGTTGHAVGAGIIAILLGPWAAVISISVVLIIQAIVFGDGGITAIGANCFNMAIVASFVSYWVFKALKGRNREKWVYAAAFLSGYAGLTAAAVATGIEFGIQPLIATAADGRPLYAPYPLSIAVPAMATGHLAVFSVIEGMVTALILRYFIKNEPESVYELKRTEATSFQKKLWRGLLIIAILTPIGIYLPRITGSGEAWGEWGTEAFEKIFGYVPEGMKRIADIWKAPISDYNFGGEGASFGAQAFYYIMSAFIGIAVIIGMVYFISRIWGRHEMDGPGPSAGLSQRRGGGRVNASYLDKGIEGFAGLFTEGHAQWDLSSRKSFMHELDARIKIFFWLFLIVVISIKRAVFPEAAICVFILGLTSLSRLNLLAFYKKVLLLAFVFGFLVALPSSLNVIVPGKVILPLLNFGARRDYWIYHVPQVIGITEEGISTVSLLTLRVANSIALSFLVLYTTPFAEIIKALKVIRVPDAFLIIITMTYKYIFTFARIVSDMYLAKKARLVTMPGGKEARQWIAGRIAFVFKKTQVECEEVFKAMNARGFSGELRLYNHTMVNAKDLAIGFFLFASGIGFIIL